MPNQAETDNEDVRPEADLGWGMPEIVIRRISAFEGQDLRAQVLRPHGGKVASGAVQYGDTAAIHLGAFKDGSLEAVVSFTPYSEDGTRTLSVYQLRGAATRTEARGLGVGTKLALAGIDICRENNARVIWCNGRTAARSFYERLGFHAVGEELITATGPHFCFKMNLDTGYAS